MTPPRLTDLLRPEGRQCPVMITSSHYRTPDAPISLGKLREALEEVAETGLRPTCVDWQDSDVF